MDKIARSTPVRIKEDSNGGLVGKAGCFREQNRYNDVAGLVRTPVHVEVKGELRNSCGKNIGGF